MAKKPVETKKPGTAIANWRDEMSGAAKRAAEMEQNTGSGGKFFTTRAGVLKYDDIAMPGNMIAAVILHGIYENTFYDSKFDPENRTPPTCFAFWDDTYPDEMQPHAKVDEDPETFTRQNDVCDGCPQNEWGSADTGKGKACGNRRRLALIPAGAIKSLGKNKGFDTEMFEDEDSFKKADLGFFKIPVTSVKGYSAYVREVSEQLGRPLWGVYTQISVVPDDRSQFKVEFELISEVPDELMDVIFKRHVEAKEAVAFPYQKREDDKEDDKAPVKNNAGKKLGGGAAAKGRQKATAKR